MEAEVGEIDLSGVMELAADAPAHLVDLAQALRGWEGSAPE